MSVRASSWSASGALVDRASNCLYCPVFGVRPAGYDAVLAAEDREVGNERVRLWYVAATRATQRLLIPLSGTGKFATRLEALATG